MEDSFDPYEMSEEDIPDVMMFMLDNGYIDIVGVDDDGEAVYKMTDRMLNDFPEIFEEHLEETNNLVFSVWQKGLLEVVMNEDATWEIQPNAKTKNYEKYSDRITKEEKLLLWEVNQMFNEQERS
jgi:hypothetical protein